MFCLPLSPPPLSLFLLISSLQPPSPSILSPSKAASAGGCSPSQGCATGKSASSHLDTLIGLWRGAVEVLPTTSVCESHGQLFVLFACPKQEVDPEVTATDRRLPVQSTLPMTSSQPSGPVVPVYILVLVLVLVPFPVPIPVLILRQRGRSPHT